ncbi:MAG: hypothetical protein ACD_22C00170G0008 [uncultured bacterium]|nr:MAG: hypothetical protein ACD_22C00170G0008 [uncultured bacterium]
MRNILLKTLPFLALLTYSIKTYAVCPVCTFAVGAGVGLARWLGVDDAITGVWAGGLVLSTGLWFDSWLAKKKVVFKGRVFVSTGLMYLLTFGPLHFTKILGHPYNTVFGIDKFIFGTIVGTLFFLLALLTDKLLRKKNAGKVYFPYQKVVLPVSFLLLASLCMVALISLI